ARKPIVASSLRAHSIFRVARCTSMTCGALCWVRNRCAREMTSKLLRDDCCTGARRPAFTPRGGPPPSLCTNLQSRSRKRPTRRWGHPFDGSGLATSAQEEKKGASWPTGQRHTCRLVRYGELLSCYGSGAPRPARRRIGRAGTCHDQGGALIMTKMNRTSRRDAWIGPSKK